MNKEIDPNRPYDPIWDMYYDEFEDATPEEVEKWLKENESTYKKLGIEVDNSDLL